MAERGIGFFWPVDQALLDGTMPPDAQNALLHIRRHYPVSPISEEMILDGALDGYSCLVMIGAAYTRAAVLREIARWVQRSGGRLLAVGLCRDLELGQVPEFDSLFGIEPSSEDAWGHTGAEMPSVPGFPKLSQIPGFHCEHGWLGLSEGTEKIAVAVDRPGQSGTRIHAISPLFRRTYKNGGQAVFYCGPVNFHRDDQACFSDPGVILALLDDLCSMSGVPALGTKDAEIARARGGERTLILHADRIEIQPVNR